MKYAPILLTLFAIATTTATAQTYSGPESVEYHARLDRHLVSNTTGGRGILARAADGTLSTFTSAPTSPYGIELLAGTLFALDSGRVKGYDIDTAAPVLDLPLAGASFLNGITSNGVDTLYVSDFSGRQLYTINVANLAAPVVSMPVSTGSITPNGLVYDRIGNRVLVATWGSSARVLAFDPVAGTTPTTLIQTSLNNIDGITLDCNGSIVVAAWSGCGTSGGCLRRFDPPFSTTSPALAVANGLSNPADIDFAWRHGQIGVPESGANRVTIISDACEGSVFYSDFER